MGTFYQTCTQVKGYFIKSYEKKNSITVNISHLTDKEAQEEPKMYFDNYSFFDMIFSPLHHCLVQRPQHQGHSYYPNINIKLVDACFYLSERGQVSEERA